MYSFNDNGNAFYNMSNSFGIVEVGSSAVMLGRLSMSTTVWNCSQSGTVFVQDLTKEFFSLTCNPCSAGSYAVDSASTLTVDRKCQTCPFGASCLGSSPQSNGLHALPSFWGLNNNGSVKFYQCPSSYCCGGINSNCTYDYCDGNRTGLLCGQCGPDHGMRFFTASCKSNSDCNDGVWFAWIIIVMTFAAVIALLMTTGGADQSSGMLSVLLYYYQVLPLIKSTPWKHTSPTLMLILQSAFNFSPSGSSSDSDGVCLIPNMTTSQKIGSRMLLQGVICLAIVVTYIVHFGCWKARIHRWFDDHRPHISHYIATWIRFCTIAYTTLVLVPLQMIQCVDIGDEHKNVWWWDASVECYRGWQKAGFAAIGILSPLPLFVILLLWKKWKGEEVLDSKWKKGIYRVLSGPYREERRWWLGVSLYRRLMMVVVYSTITDLNWRAMSASGLCVIFLVMNYVMQPFRNAVTHRSECGSLLLLCMISILSSPQLSQIEFGTTSSIFGEEGLEWIQFLIGIGPAAGYVILSGYGVFDYFLKRRKSMKNEDIGGQEREWIGYGSGEDIECEMCKASNNNEHGFEWRCEIHQYC